MFYIGIKYTYYDGAPTHLVQNNPYAAYTVMDSTYIATYSLGTTRYYIFRVDGTAPIQTGSNTWVGAFDVPATGNITKDCARIGRRVHFISYPESTSYRPSSSYSYGYLYMCENYIIPNPANSWYSGSNYVGGDTRYRYNRTVSGSVNSSTTNYVGPKSHQTTSIVELYHKNNYTNSASLYTKLYETFSAASYEFEIYSLGVPNQQHSVIPQSSFSSVQVGGSGSASANREQRAIYAIHFLDQRGSSRDVCKVTYSGSAGSVLSTTNYAVGSYGESGADFDNWVEHTSGDGNKYFAITCGTSNVWTYKTLLVEQGKSYDFTLHTYSGAGQGGIIISNTTLSSSVSMTTGGLARCSGVNANTTYSYIPQDDETLYIYFKTNYNSNVYEYEDDYQYQDSHGTHTGYEYEYYSLGTVSVEIKDIYTVTLNKNGGTGGSSSFNYIKGTQPGGQGTTISVPHRGPTTYQGSPDFMFMGYYDTQNNTGGTQYINSNGVFVVAPTSDMTLYARWVNMFSYPVKSPDAYGNPTIIAYCTNQAVAQSSTTSQVSVVVSNDGWHSSACPTQDGTDTTITVVAIQRMSGTSYNFSLSHDGKTLYIPSGVPAGTYYISVTLSTQGLNAANGYMSYTSGGAILYVQLLATSVSNYGDIKDHTVTVNSSCSTYPYLPASEITFTSNNVTSYLSSSAKQTITYNNGATKDIDATISWGGTVMTGTNCVLSSLGTTYSYNPTYANIPTNALVVTAVSNGKTHTFNPPAVYRQPNVITSLTISAVDNPITYGGSTYMHVIAGYTSGATTDVVDESDLTVTTTPSNVINITNE